jgi:hypothetical protein
MKTFTTAYFKTIFLVCSTSYGKLLAISVELTGLRIRPITTTTQTPWLIFKKLGYIKDFISEIIADIFQYKTRS